MALCLVCESILTGRDSADTEILARRLCQLLCNRCRGKIAKMKANGVWNFLIAKKSK